MLPNLRNVDCTYSEVPVHAYAAGSSRAQHQRHWPRLRAFSIARAFLCPFSLWRSVPKSEYLAKLHDGQRALEISSGKGVHLRHYASTFRRLLFTGTECDEYGLHRVRQANLDNMEAPMLLDLLEERHWAALESKATVYDAIFGSNFMHMVPLQVAFRLEFRNLLTIVSDQSRGR